MSNSRNAPTRASREAAAKRAAEARARIEAAQRRRRLTIVLTAVGVVVVVIVALIVVKVAVGNSSPKSGQKASAVGNTVSYDVTHVPASVLDSVGKGTASLGKVPSLTGAALTSGGKPEVLYIGAEWCPYCAATRWSLAVALSRFGTLSGFGQTASSPSDVYANTPTLTFHGASYTSSVIAFVGREVQSNEVVDGQRQPLDKLTAAETALFDKAGGGFPYINFGNKYLVNSAPFLPPVIDGMTHQQIAAALSNAKSPVAQAIDGGANLITAQICKITGNKPAAVCDSTGVSAAA